MKIHSPEILATIEPLAETREMAASREDWSAWERAAADGLDDLPWQAGRKGRVAERIALPSGRDLERGQPQQFAKIAARLK